MSTTWRTVRVFISSTFRDMQAEREELVKRVFPQLRKLCEERGVGFVEVDLRWGVTEEQTQRGEVLPICLAEIDRCRPYFIGLLGERYGWVPDEIPGELVAEQPWLAEHRSKSVTELEIVHGVLRNPAMANRACFYFRDPAYVEQVAPEQRADFVETDPAARKKLAALKDHIRQSGLAWKDYSDPEALGPVVLRDLTAAINQEYPPEQAPDALQREALEHEAFAQSRTGVYIGRQEYFDRLDEHAAASEDGPGLVVLGESGSGKSALLANWATRYRQEHPDDLMLVHFVGASPYSADWAAMLRRVMGELKRRFEIAQDIPDEPEALRLAFANWLHMAAARCTESPSPVAGEGRGEGATRPSKIVLILDGLNQLEDRDGAPDLVWLPPVIPGNVCLIVSTLPGRPLDELRKRGWPTLDVKPFEPEERRRFIRDYLAQFTKALGPDRIERVVAAPASANPLYLQALLEELRVFGVHEHLDQRIDHYLAAATVPALYEQILERYEEDYERHRPNLVRDAMALLWAARRGLSEAELLDLLGTDGQPLARTHWSPLYLAAERSLINRSGVIGFFHDGLRMAVRHRYLPSEATCDEAHVRLADYFQAHDLGPRKIDELPWQLAATQHWQRLYDLLSDMVFFSAAWDADQSEVKSYWTRIQTESSLRITDAYRGVIRHRTQEPPRHLWSLAGLLADMGHLVEALAVGGNVMQHYRAIGDRESLQTCLGMQARIMCRLGIEEDAMALFKEQEQICRELGRKDGLAGSLHGQALVLKDQGDLDRAMALLNEKERICRELPNQEMLSTTLCAQALVLRARGDLDEAAALLTAAERICRDVGRKDGLAGVLHNQAMILNDRGDLNGAMLLYRQADQLLREVGDRVSLSQTLTNLANVHSALGRLDWAMRDHQEAEQIAREVGNEKILQACLGNQANTRRDQGDLDGAMALLKEQEEICRHLGNKKGLHRSLEAQAIVLRKRGDLDGAMAKHKEEEQLCRQLGDKKGLHRSLEAQAVVLRKRGDLDAAMAKHKEEEQLCRQLGDEKALQRSLGGQAFVLRERGDLDAAMAKHKEEEQLCRQSGNKEGLRTSLGGQACILHRLGDLDGAMALYKQDEELSRETGSRSDLQYSLGGQANILYKRGDLKRAMVLFKKQEAICREIADHEELALTLLRQALILCDDMRRPHEAAPLAEEAYRLASERGSPERVRQAKRVVDVVRTLSQGGRIAASPSRGHVTNHEDAELDPAYRDALAQWKALPWWKRMLTKRPERLGGT